MADEGAQMRLRHNSCASPVSSESQVVSMIVYTMMEDAVVSFKHVYIYMYTCIFRIDISYMSIHTYV